MRTAESIISYCHDDKGSNIYKYGAHKPWHLVDTGFLFTFGW